MALSANTIHEVRSGGSDTANGGVFDPSQTAGMFTDGAATSASGNSPIFSSASYNFVAGDVGAWLFIASGTNWLPGWYKIASVASNQATLSAAIAASVGYDSAKTLPSLPNTVAGCATTASPTAATWSIDYSQQDAAQFSYTDLASAGAGLLVSSVTTPFAKQMVGNGLIIASGTNFTAGVYVVASVAAGVATVVGAGNITTGAGVSGVGGLGGGFASVGKSGSIFLAGNSLFIKGNATITSASNNVAGGCFSTAGQAYICGYGTVRFDGTRPTITAGSISTFVMFTVLAIVSTTRDLVLDGALRTSSRGIANGYIINVKGQNFTNTALFSNNNSEFIGCEATGCTTTAPAIYNNAGECIGCWSHDNSVTGFWTTYSSFCYSTNNTGGSSRGFDDGFTIIPGFHKNSTAYGNGSDGFKQNGTTNCMTLLNCLSYGNLAWGINGTAVTQVRNCALGSNTSGPITGVRLQAIINTVTASGGVLTADPFTNKASNDFSLNNNAGGGAACRAAGFPGVFPGGLTTGYKDIGAVQHQDSGGGSVSTAPRILQPGTYHFIG